jgi:glycosyltransferase involved in cell wall biosynthesis
MCRAFACKRVPVAADGQMRVVVIADYAHINGGQAKVAIESAKGLKARGLDVDYFAAVGPVEPSLHEAGVKVHVLSQPDVETAASLASFGLQWAWNREAALALDALLADCDPSRTIVHVHGWSKALSPSIGSVFRRREVAVVHTLHDFGLVCPNGNFYDYPAVAACSRKPMSLACLSRNCDPKNGLRKVLRVTRFILMRQFSGMIETAGHVIAVSGFQRALAEPYFPKGTRFYELSNPIDVAPVPPRGVGPAGEFFFVGRLAPEKGPAIFAEGARRAGVRAVFVGDGPELETLPLRYPEAQFLGWKPPAEVREILRHARALVFPSVCYEGQPLTVLESLALGTPVVVSAGCAGREAVTDGETGLWFKAGDPDSLAAALTRLRDDTLARRMGEAARAAYWRDPLTLERHVDGLLRIYRELPVSWSSV